MIVRLGSAILAFMLVASDTLAADPLPACWEGSDLILEADKFERATELLTRCIDHGNMDSEQWAVAHHNRAVARFFTWFYLENVDSDYAWSLLEDALDDSDIAVEYDPYDPKHFCQRGNIIFYLSMGMDGFHDLDEANRLGGPDYVCEIFE